MMRTIWTCIRNPRYWRDIFEEQIRTRSSIQSWEEEGKAAVLSAYETKVQREQLERHWANDPITGAVRGYPYRGKKP